MSIAVILPNYNHARWLPRALAALANQAPAPTRIVVVDDASTDHSVSIIEEFQKRYPFIHLIRHGANKGAEAAVKTALEHVQEDFLLFAAADDFVLPNLFAHAISALRDNPDAAFFCSEVALVNENDDVIGFRPATIPRTTSGYVSPLDVRRTIRKSDNWFVGASIVYRHARLAEIGYFDSSLGTLQDAMATRLLAFRHGFYFEPEVLATWRILKESLSMQSSLSSSENIRLLGLARIWIEKNFPTDVKQEYAALFDRRLRFNFARQRLEWRQGALDIEGIAEGLGGHRIDRAILRFAEKIPQFSSAIILTWLALRMRPYRFGPLLASGWRTLTLNPSRCAALKQTIATSQFDGVHRGA